MRLDHELITREFSRGLADELRATLPPGVWWQMDCQAWRNDTCVRFSGTVDGKPAILWVDHADPDKRYDETSARYTLQIGEDAEALSAGEYMSERTSDEAADVVGWLAS